MMNSMSGIKASDRTLMFVPKLHLTIEPKLHLFVAVFFLASGNFI
jgi:hypothetical protein